MAAIRASIRGQEDHLFWCEMHNLHPECHALGLEQQIMECFTAIETLHNSLDARKLDWERTLEHRLLDPLQGSTRS